jgi:hypothetical protein
MRLEGVAPGDLVRIDHLGRRYTALVIEVRPGELEVEPLNRHITWRTAKPRQVIDWWKHMGRAAATAPRRGQTALEVVA